MTEKTWEVIFSAKSGKQKTKLPKRMADAFAALLKDLERLGPEAKKWPNFGPIYGKTGVFHCHLNKGKPRYVAVWRVNDWEIQIMEVRYVGTHEGADYRKIN